MGRPFVVITLAYVAGLLLAPAAPVSFIWLFGAASLLLIPALAVARSRAVLVWPLLVLAGWTNYLIHTQAVSPHAGHAARSPGGNAPAENRGAE